MEALRRQEKFLGMFSRPEGNPDSAGGDELEEEEVFWGELNFSASPVALPPPSPSFSFRDARKGGILAALRPSIPPSTARMIPAGGQPKWAAIGPRSAPVNVPMAPRWRWAAPPGGTADSDDDGEPLPPHEMAARKRDPMSSFSVLEGAGRTLKGSDLQRVRNAVWRQTGFTES
ncbi:uncharacterized protein LOC144705719 [Wolffia australiana]